MPQSDFVGPDIDTRMAESYRQLGLAPGASMRHIEAAYWRFARELRGQSAMAPYTKAYEALANSVRPAQHDGSVEEAATPDAIEQDQLAVRPTSKFGWPER